MNKTESQISARWRFNRDSHRRQFQGITGERHTVHSWIRHRDRRVKQTLLSLTWGCRWNGVRWEITALRASWTPSVTWGVWLESPILSEDYFWICSSDFLFCKTCLFSLLCICAWQRPGLVLIITHPGKTPSYFGGCPLAHSSFRAFIYACTHSLFHLWAHASIQLYLRDNLHCVEIRCETWGQLLSLPVPRFLTCSLTIPTFPTS